MSDVMVVVKRTYFDWEERKVGRLLPGRLLENWDDYKSDHPFLDLYLVDGDRIFLVTARPGGRLWLLAVYEDVERRRDGWFGRRNNRTRIVDITALKSKLRFHTGKGLIADPAKLGNSLQSPRKLTGGDLALLEGVVARQKVSLLPPRVAPTDDESGVQEGERMQAEIQRYSRSQSVVLDRLELDRNTCRHCGFVVSPETFPRLRNMSRVVQVHHVRPLSDGRRKTTKKDLITLCPTCHAVAHSIARALGDPKVGIGLLKKHYRV